MAEYYGKQGEWRTLPNGVHIFIEKGQSLEDAMKSFDESGWESEYKKSEFNEQLLESFTYADLQGYYTDKEHKRIKPAQVAKRKIRTALQSRDYRDPEMDAIIIGGIKNKVREFIVNDRNTAWFKPVSRRIQISINGNDCEIVESIGHEIGHAIDHSITGYKSSTYHSELYGLTMREALFNEFNKNLTLDKINEEANALSEAMSKVRKDYLDGKFKSDRQYLQAYYRLDDAAMCLCDMTQAVYGDNECLKIFGELGHEAGYYNKSKALAATECFAELTSCLFWNKDKTFYNLMNKYCPETIEIYHEILDKEVESWK